MCFFIRTPGWLIAESHFYGLPFSSLSEVLDAGILLGERRAELLPPACTLLEVRASIENTYHDSLALSRGVMLQGNAAWPDGDMAKNVIGVTIRSNTTGWKCLEFGAVPGGILKSDTYSPLRNPAWSDAFEKYLDALIGKRQFAPGTWGFIGVSTDPDSNPRIRIADIAGNATDDFATVTTLAAHNIEPGSVIKIGLCPKASDAAPVNQVWEVGAVTDDTLVLENFPVIADGFSLGIGGYLKNQQRSFRPYSSYAIRKTATRVRRDTCSLYSWEIEEAPYNAILNPGCYAMAVFATGHAYRTKARIFRDNDLEVTLRWFKVPDGQPFLPTPHLWAGRPWRYDRTPPTRGPGELTQDHIRYSNGKPPTVCWNWLGSDDWWANGIPFADADSTPQTRPGICQSVYEPVYDAQLNLTLLLEGVGGVGSGCCPGVVLPTTIWISMLSMLTTPPVPPSYPGSAFPLTYTASLEVDTEFGPGWLGTGSYSPGPGKLIYYSVAFFCGSDFAAFGDAHYYISLKASNIAPPGTVFTGGTSVQPGGVCRPFYQPFVAEVYPNGFDPYLLGPPFATYFENMVVTPYPLFSGQLNFVVTLNGVVPKTGQLNLVVTLAGKLIPVENVTMPLVLDLAGDAVPAVTGLLPLALTLDGEAAVALSGLLPLALTLAGSTATTVAGELDLTVTLSGAATPSVTTSGSLPLTVTLAGTAATESAGSLPLTVTLSGAATPSVTTSGSLPLTVTLTGTATPSVTTSGSLPLTVTLAGTAAPVLAGSLPLAVTLAGTAAPVVSASGSLPLTVTLAGTATVGTPTVIRLFSGSANPWTVPSDWNSLANTIEGIGASGASGAGGTSTTTPKGYGGGGGGGGAYAIAHNVALTPGATVAFVLGVGGSSAGVAGTPTTFGVATLVAAGGTGGTSGTTVSAGLGGSGGLASACTPTSGAFSGGNGANGGNGGAASTNGGGGGGGAAGPNGAGANGVAGGVQGGKGGNADNGVGGAGGAASSVAGNAGATGSEWPFPLGCGGGGGGGGAVATVNQAGWAGGQGVDYGGGSGGGGGAGGHSGTGSTAGGVFKIGESGAIFITYWPI